MSYTTGIPRSGQSLGNSRPQVQGNFDYINTAFAINHVAFNSSGFGKHKFVDLVEGLPDPVPAGGTNTVFSKVGGVFALGELFYVRGAGGTPIQMTNGNILANANGYSFLPGGILVQWGSTTSSGTGTRNVNFVADGNINFPTACWHVFAQTHITNVSNGIVWTTANISTTGFALGTNPEVTPSGTSFSWFAIGN